MPQARFAVLGDVMTDIVARIPHPPHTGTDTAARITTTHGGGAANLAAWLAEFGAEVLFIARVGDDGEGRAAAHALEAAGVRCAWTVDTTRSTGACIVIVTADGERSMLPDAGANDALAPTDIPSDAFAPDRHLHVSAYTLFKSGSRAAGLIAIRRAVDEGMSTSVDVSSTAPLAQVGVAQFLDWTAGVRICFANADEARLMSGVDDLRVAARTLAASYPLVVVKCGAHGALAYSSETGLVEVPAHTGPVVDTTGAGDAFAAGFLATYAQDATVEECLQVASRTAGRAVAGVGARP